MRRAFHGGSFFEAIGPRLDALDLAERIVSADVLDAWFDPAPAVTEALAEHLPFLLKTSPPTHAEGLTEVISEVRNIGKERIIVGAGSSDLIFLLFPYLDSRTLILDPMYGEYSFILESVVGCDVVRHFLDPQQGFRLCLKELATTIERERPAVVTLVNPNSPTGHYVHREGLIELIDRFPQVQFVIDEAYVDFVDRTLSLETVSRSNLIVIKSLSKVYALSGVRAAYMVAPPQLVESLAPKCPPWSVSLPAQLAAIKALQSQDYYDARYLETHLYREEFVAWLKEERFDVINDCANFILLEVDEAERVCALAKESGVYLRNCDSMSSRFSGQYLRIAVKAPAMNIRILEALKRCRVSC